MKCWSSGVDQLSCLVIRIRSSARELPVGNAQDSNTYVDQRRVSEPHRIDCALGSRRERETSACISSSVRYLTPRSEGGSNDVRESKAR